MAKKSKVKGYVYILTNRSFKEDWVKIGKSSKEVDVRSKQLYNTAVPLPFEIYATVKTSQYEDLEKKVHDILTDVADKRVNPKREFFNITPQKAAKTLKSYASLIDDAELNFPDDMDGELSGGGKAHPTKFHKKGKYTVNTKEKFKFARETTDATMVVKDGKRYIVLKGSYIDKKTYSHSTMVKRLRTAYANYIKNGKTTKNLEFGSPSSAGVFVGGGACNGKFYWRTKNGKPLNDFIKYDKKK